MQSGPPAAHKPGAVPLRPLGLGDIFDAAFKIVRFNPQATVGASALLAVVTMGIPLVISAGVLAGGRVLPMNDQSASVADYTGLFLAFGSYLLGVIAQSFGTVLLTAMTAHVVLAASIGRRLTLQEAWAATRGRRWAVIGLSLLMGLVWLVVIGLVVGFWVLFLATDPSVGLIVVLALITVVALVVFGALFYVRVSYLAGTAMMLERTSVLGSMGRALALSRRQFWRMLGILFLTGLVVGVAGSLVSFPISMIGNAIGLAAVGDDAGKAAAVSLMSSSLGRLASTALVTPFTAAVTGLQYLDQRMRKESFDVELMRRAGILGQ